MNEDLIDLSADERAFLSERLGRGICVTYEDQLLPPGTEPGHGRVGVEHHAEGVVLHVERGHTYDGVDPLVRAWISTGSRTFSTVDDLGRWLSSAVSTPAHAPVARSGRPSVAAPGEITRLGDVVAPEPAIVDADSLHAALSSRVVGH
jgi:hypothetical protein